MSNKKVTYEELISVIADQSGQSNLFVHDFIRDFVAIINEGLESDGNVNIAGLGKFELQKIDDREGYSPQGDEKISIPPHNKIVFKPHKDLRELVNAPYIHMEPEIIEEEGDDHQQTLSEQTKDQSQGDKQEKIPSSSLPVDSDAEAEDEPEKKKAPWEEDMESDPGSVPSFKSRHYREKEPKGIFWIIAAAFIIVLLAIGAWYFFVSQQDATPGTMATESVQNNRVPDNQPMQPDTDPAQNQNADDPSGTDKQTSANNQQQDKTGRQQSQQANTSTKTVIVVQGQTLWGLADTQYDNPYLWPWIYDTNKSSIDNPDIIIIGQSLDIPLRSGTKNRLSNNDSLQVALGYVETYRWYKENNLENAKFYLYAAKKYHSRVFEYTDAKIDEADLAFANRAQ